MNKIIEALRSWGCEVDNTMERMADDEDFYLECLQDVAQDPYFPALDAALKSGDLKESFDTAHTLKGVLANVGLTPMLNKVIEIVEPLRRGSHEDLSEQYRQLMQMKAHLESILRGE